MRNIRLALFVALASGLVAPGVTQAGSVTYDFTTDPSAAGFTLSGTTLWNSTGGNPGGFVRLTDAVDSQRGALLLPDFDSGKIIKSFTVTMDVRVGAGTDLPAEGWSISFVPPTAQVVTNGADGPGWASDFVPTANLPERGSLEGLGVEALTFDHGGGDVLGFSVRLNQVQFALGGWNLPPSGPKIYNGACTNIYSMQTGPNTNGVAGLCWGTFKLVMHEGGFLDIYWKGNPVVTNFATGWKSSSGRFILGARTSVTGTTGGNEIHDFDNIAITTALEDRPLLVGFQGGPGGFSYALQDIPGGVLNPSSIVLQLDGANVAVSSIATTSGTNNLVTYNRAPNYFTAGSSHTASISYTSVAGSTGLATNFYTVPAYVVVPTNLMVTGVNTGLPGFQVRPYQTVAAQPNSLAWTELQLAGAQGPNIADLSGTNGSGYYANSGVINYDISSGATSGHFNAPQYPNAAAPGIPGTQFTTGNFTEEITTWLYFPAAGSYRMGVNSDDGFKVSTALNVHDPNGLLLGQYDGGRGASDTLFTFVIQAPGYYPFRLIWENGNGELPGNLASCEWFTQQPDGSFVLVNDPANATAIAAYQSGPTGPPYVRSFNGNLAGFEIDLQDGSTAVNTGTIVTKLNGAVPTPAPSITHTSGVTAIVYTPTVPFTSGSTQTVQLVYADTAAVYQTNNFSFVIAGAVVSTGWAVPASQVDKTQTGFRVRPYQTTAAQPNDIPWTELQLAGLKGTNIAELSTAVNGWYTNNVYTGNGSGVVNYDTATFADHFSGDMPFPGLPGTTASTDNSAEEILCLVEFPVAGTYTMGVNSDDGFKVTIGREPRDQFATVLAQTPGVSDTTFQMYVPQAGIYPMRLIWENGGGALHLEWYSIQPDGTYTLVGDPYASGALSAYQLGPAGPAYVSTLSPNVNERNVAPNGSMLIKITDQATTVNTTDILGITVNGVATTPSVSKAGGVTTISNSWANVFAGGLLPPGSTNTGTLVYRDSSSTIVTQSWQFVASPYKILPPGLATPVGSGDATKPGFRYRIDQYSPGVNGSTLQNQVERAEQNLALLWGPNQSLSSANIASPTTADIPGVVNYSVAGDIGDFQTTNGFPDAPFPGLPTPQSGANDDNDAAEFVSFIEFPQAGFYTMGVNSDDCFRVQPIDRNVFLGDTVNVLAPASLAGQKLPGLRTLASDGGFGSRLPWPPITAKVVPMVNLDGCSAPLNPAQLAGNIALCQRGTCEFGLKALNAQNAGAIAVLVYQNRLDLPIGMGAGASGGQVTIPVMMMSQYDGSLLAAAAATNDVWATLGTDPTMNLGEYNTGGGRGSSDTTFSFGVTQPGVYPFRLVWNNGGGGANVEWFMVEPDGSKVPLNATSNPLALKTYRNRTVATPPSLSIVPSGSNLTLIYGGTLQAASSVTGPYVDVPGAYSPYVVPASMSAQFFRVRQAE